MELPRGVVALTDLYGGVTAAETVIMTAVRDHILGKVPFHP